MSSSSLTYPVPFKEDSPFSFLFGEELPTPSLRNPLETKAAQYGTPIGFLFVDVAVYWGSCSISDWASLQRN